MPHTKDNFESLLLANLSDGLLAFDRESRYIHWNPAMEKISGVKSDAILGKIAFEVFPFLREKGYAEYHRRVLAGETFKTNRESYNIPETGKMGIFEAHYSPLREISGEIVGGTCTIRNVTDTMEDEIKRGEQRFHELVDIVPNIIWASDAGGINKFVNRYGIEYTGLEAGKTNFEHWIKVLHPDEITRITDSWVAAFQATRAFEIQHRLKRASDGAYRWVLCRGFPVLDEAGRAKEWIGTITDIHEQVLASMRMTQLQSVTAALSSAVTLDQVADTVITDGLTALGAQGGVITMLSDDGESMSILLSRGHPIEMMKGFTTYSMNKPIPMTDVARTRKPVHVASVEEARARYPVIADAMASWGAHSVSALPLIVKDRVIGAFSISFADPCVIDEEQERFMLTLAGLCSQALDRGRIYEAERIARSQAETANSAKSNFLANVSHEIRTPLCSIIGYAELLTKPSLVPGKRDSFIDGINRNGKALVRLVDDILDLSKIEAGHVALDRIEFPLGSFLGEIVDLLRQEADRKGVALEFAQSLRMPAKIVSDPFRLRQILLNIAGNAIKFTEKGRVSMSVSRSPANDVYPDFLCFRIEDTGIGMKHEALERLFRPFSQGHGALAHKYGGTGLGLVISRNLARMLGGDVELVCSSPGRGSTFDVRIPTTMAPLENRLIVDGEADRDRAMERTPLPAALAGLRILLAEDSPDVQQIISNVLTDQGAAVDVVADGEQAVEKAMKRDYSLILMDLQMPKLDGSSATSALRARGLKKPIVAITANALVDKIQLFEDGFDAYVIKPIENRSFIQKIRQLARNRFNASSSAARSPYDTASP